MPLYPPYDSTHPAIGRQVRLRPSEAMADSGGVLPMSTHSSVPRSVPRFFKSSEYMSAHPLALLPPPIMYISDPSTADACPARMGGVCPVVSGRVHAMVCVSRTTTSL